MEVRTEINRIESGWFGGGWGGRINEVKWVLWNQCLLSAIYGSGAVESQGIQQKTQHTKTPGTIPHLGLSKVVLSPWLLPPTSSRLIFLLAFSPKNLLPYGIPFFFFYIYIFFFIFLSLFLPVFLFSFFVFLFLLFILYFSLSSFLPSLSLFSFLSFFPSFPFCLCQPFFLYAPYPEWTLHRP